MKVVAYLRVSTDVQAEKGLGLEVQERAIKTWAKTNGHRVVLWCRDAGVSGSNGLDTRRELPMAVAALRAGEADGLVVYRLDRLARDLMIQETILGDMRRMRVAVFSTSAAESAYLEDDPGDPSRKLIRQVLGAVAEYERAMTRLRLEAGRARKREKGGYAGHGSPAFGYRAATVQGEQGRNERALIPDAEEQKTIARVAQLREQISPETGQPLSFREIAAALTAEGHKPKRSATWHPMMVRRIVARLRIHDAGDC